jgi:hypothetical protein
VLDGGVRNTLVSRRESGSAGVQQAGISVSPPTPSSSTGMDANPSAAAKATNQAIASEAVAIIEVLEPWLFPRAGIR